MGEVLRDLARFTDAVRDLFSAGVIGQEEARALVVAAADSLGLSTVVTSIRTAA